MASGPLHPDLASLRNILRLKPAVDAFRIAEAVSESSKSAKKKSQTQREISSVCCPLPFPLQDLCLLVIISDLDCHPTDLLASLPRWLRHRLLNVLPAIDLARLESTPVADGIDVNALWKRHNKPLNKSVTGIKHSTAQPGIPVSGSGSYSTSTTESSLQLTICKVDDGLSTHSAHKRILMEEIKSALKDVERKKISEGKDNLLAFISDILTNVPKIDLTSMIHKLISIDGRLMFSNLLSGSMHQSCRRSDLCTQGVWKKQATALAVNVKFEFTKNPLQIKFRPLPRASLFGVNLDSSQGIQLTPHRSLPVMYNFDPLEVLSLLANDCDLQPASAYIHIDSISEPFLQSMCSERLVLDCGTDTSSNSSSCASVINHILGKVSVLRLRCDNYSYIEVMKGMIDAATADYQLQLLVCTLPNLFVDFVKPLSNLFSLQNFNQLLIEVDDIHLVMLSRLLNEFMAVSCAHVHKLTILVKKGIALPTLLKENQLAGHCKGGSQVASTSCSSELKVLRFSSEKESTQSLYLILQLPTIRLKKIALVDLNNYHDYVHLCAIHPDLQTTKLLIDLSGVDTIMLSHSTGAFRATIQTDIVALFEIPSLQKITVSGNWGKHEEVKLGLVQGLRSRSRRSLPLRKLALELELNNSYKMGDFQMLCNAIFSLPQLKNLKLVLGKGFADMIRQPGYEATLYRSWRRRGSQVQLKSICLQTYDTKFERISLITQKVTFAVKEKKTTIPQRHKDIDFDSSRWLWMSDDPYDDCYDEDNYYDGVFYDEYGDFYEY